jgi:cholesterol transport system auxiliary component
MIGLSFARPCRLSAAVLLVSLVGGCGALRSATTPTPSFFSLDSTYNEAPGAATEATHTSGMPSMAAAAKSRRWRDGDADSLAHKVRDGDAAPTLIVNPTHAASGFDSERMMYVRAAHQLEYFSHHEWIDTPARMIVPLIVSALERSPAFRAIVHKPSAAAGDLRLDTKIVRLQHEFGSPPSRVRFTLRATLVDNTTRRVLASREFDTSVAAVSADPRGGVVAANRAVQVVLAQLADFCTETAEQWRPSDSPSIHSR